MATDFVSTFALILEFKNKYLLNVFSALFNMRKISTKIILEITVIEIQGREQIPKKSHIQLHMQ